MFIIFLGQFLFLQCDIQFRNVLNTLVSKIIVILSIYIFLFFYLERLFGD
jgi:hypothetical protein